MHTNFGDDAYEQEEREGSNSLFEFALEHKQQKAVIKSRGSSLDFKYNFN